MTLDRELRESESAVRELRQPANNADGWNHSQRAQFNAQRLSPLITAGENLVRVLHRTEDQLRQARADLSKPE